MDNSLSGRTAVATGGSTLIGHGVTPSRQNPSVHGVSLNRHIEALTAVMNAAYDRKTLSKKGPDDFVAFGTLRYLLS